MRPKNPAQPVSAITEGFSVVGLTDGLLVTGITHNSREVVPGDIYVALPGSNHHGIEFLSEAISKGAIIVASDRAGLNQVSDCKLPSIELSNPRKDMAVLASRVYRDPSAKLSIVGVTGTNGKTSVTHILQSLFTNFGYQVGVIGTVGTYIAGTHIPGVRTTPESTDLNAVLAKMLEEKVTHVFMEVSSHALEMDRVAGIKFSEVVFTNLSQDHLDFHGSMEKYFAAKAKLFSTEFAKHSVICIDDSWGIQLANQVGIPTVTVGAHADWSITEVRLSVKNTDFKLSHKDKSWNGTIPMVGYFNATNAAIAVAVASELGLIPDLITQELIKVRSVPGRSQIVTHNSAGTAIVDYAHTPEAVEKVLTTLREVCDGQLITVLGCGGDRDALKRPLMGSIAAQLSDLLIVTDDNPRSENPDDIRGAVLAGTKNSDTQILEVGDRRLAIRTALAKASHSDIVAVLGKGHEQGQEFAGVIHPFDDVEVIQQEAKNV